MAVKTMSANSGGEGKFDEGWHELVISSAEYGVYKGSDTEKKYVDLLFEGYPENMNLRIYEVINKTTNEEFKIASLFKYANAGIMGVLKDPTGKRPVIQYDDEASGLVNKKVNVYFYKEAKTGKGYTRMYDNIAPIEHEGEYLSYTADQVLGIKSAVEKNFKKMMDSTTNVLADTTVTPMTDTDTESIPF